MSNKFHLLFRLVALLTAATLMSCQDEPKKPTGEIKTNCKTTGCTRGVCDNSTGKCIDKRVCTAQTEQVDCIEGSRCINRECQASNKICASGLCTRGVCNASKGTCVSSSSCNSIKDCLFGEYCSAGSCVKNKCEDKNTGTAVDCSQANPAGGVCNPASGLCEEPESCESSAQCRAGRNCVKGTPNNHCEFIGTECGTSCHGPNHRCNYFAGTLEAKCVRLSSSCSVKSECDPGEVCNAGQCVTPPATCSDTKYEPFDESSPYNYSKSNDLDAKGWLQGLGLCAGDVDEFQYEVTSDQGVFVAEFELTDGLGNGDVTFYLLDKNGAEVATKEVKAKNQKPGEVYSLTYSLPASSVGSKLTLDVKASSQLAGLISYRFRASLAPAGVKAVCDNAKAIVSGTPQQGKIAPGAQKGVEFSCGNVSASAPAQGWTFSLPAESYVELKADAVGYSLDPRVAIRSTCTSSGSEVACAEPAGLLSKSATVAKILPKGDYTAIVSAHNDNGQGDYTLTFTATPTSCKAGAALCDSSGDTLQRCNATRTGMETVSCPNKCNTATNTCFERTGESCQYPTKVTSFPFSETINLGNYKDDHNGSTCSPIRNAVGKDVVYQIEVPNDQRVYASITDNSTSYSTTNGVSLYLLDNCAATERCLYAAQEEKKGGFLYWKNTTGASKTVYLVVDSNSSLFSYDDLSVTINVGTPLCDPGTFMCANNPPTSSNWGRFVCDTFGAAWDLDRQCSSTCGVNKANECDLPANGLCNKPVELHDGDRVTGDLSDSPKIANSIPDACFSTARAQNAHSTAQLYYSVTPNKGDVVTINVIPDKDHANKEWDPYIWVTGAGCSDVGGGKYKPGSCLSAADLNFIGKPETLTFTANDNKTYIIAVESDSKEYGPFTITANIGNKCTPYSTIGCTADGSALQTCDGAGNIVTFPCTCRLGKCTSATGATCADPIPLVGQSGSETGTFDSTKQKTFDPGTGEVGECYFNNTIGSMRGYDVVYKVTLNPRQLFHADLVGNSSNDNIALYIETTCGNDTSCVGARDTFTKSIDYYSESGETIYLVADSRFEVGSNPYTLNWRITDNAECLPDKTVCVGTTEVKHCSTTGMKWSKYECPNSTTCANGVCNVPSSDTCSTSVPSLGSGATIAFDTESSAHPHSAAKPVCVGSSATYPLASYYSVLVKPGDIVTITARPERTDGFMSGPFDNNTDPYFFIASDCATPTPTCLVGRAGRDVTYSKPEVLTYTATTAGTLYLALGSVQGSTLPNPAKIYYTVDVSSKASCSLDAAPVCTPDKSSLIYCDDGVNATFKCADSCNSGACLTHSGDRCVDAIPLNPSNANSGSLTGNLSDKRGLPVATNTVKFRFDSSVKGKAQACAFDPSSLPTKGVERIYSVHLDKGDKLDVKLSSADGSAIIYMLDSCNASVNNCLALGTQTKNDYLDYQYVLSYVSKKSGDYYFVVDTSGSTRDEDYKIDWTIQSFATCVPNKYECVDSNTLGLCNDKGDGVTKFSCNGKCSGSTCDVEYPALKTCTAAKIAAAQPISGDYTMLIDPSKLLSTENKILSCSHSTASSFAKGPEAFIPFTLAKGKSIEITMRPTDIKSTYLVNILNDCVINDTNCVAGNRWSYSNFKYSSATDKYAQMTFQNTSSTVTTYYLYIDEDQFNTHAPYHLTFHYK